MELASALFGATLVSCLPSLPSPRPCRATVSLERIPPPSRELVEVPPHSLALALAHALPFDWIQLCCSAVQYSFYVAQSGWGAGSGECGARGGFALIAPRLPCLTFDMHLPAKAGAGLPTRELEGGRGVGGCRSRGGGRGPSRTARRILSLSDSLSSSTQLLSLASLGLGNSPG